MKRRTDILKLREVRKWKCKPDEIIFTIKYSEYWKEEFEKGKVYADYVTKIPIERD